MLLRRVSAVVLLLIFIASPGTLLAQTPAPAQPGQQPQGPPKDPNDPIEKIKDEGMNRSEVMKTLELSQRRHWAPTNRIPKYEAS